MTPGETRFKACKDTSESYLQSFHVHGRQQTTELAKGIIEASVGALEHLEGEAAAYNFLTGLADDIALKLAGHRT